MILEGSGFALPT